MLQVFGKGFLCQLINLFALGRIMDVFGISVQKTGGRYDEYYTCYDKACQEFDRHCSNLFREGKIIMIQVCLEEKKQILKLREVVA